MSNVYIIALRHWIEDLSSTYSVDLDSGLASPIRQRACIADPTAGLHRRSDRPFGVGETGYRLIPKDVETNDLVMSHISTNFDRTGFQMDMNMVFPLDRLRELEQHGFIGSLAEYHYSFMGATPPDKMEQEAHQLSAILKKDQVDAVLLVPV